MGSAAPLPAGGEGLGVGLQRANLSPHPLSACGEGELNPRPKNNFQKSQDFLENRRD
jgi:hypothetical protein